MPKKATAESRLIPAIKVPQWLDQWDEIRWDKKNFQSKPEKHFYLLSLPASILKSLTGVYRRSAKSGPRVKDPNVQRGHQEGRSLIIRDFVQHGYPLCEMTEAQRSAPNSESLRKPGWLPSAIIVNILTPQDQRNKLKISNSDLITVEEAGAQSNLLLPESFTGVSWEPASIYPLEVIDGQHRLWAFDNYDPGKDFSLPVVAFHGLDRSWQAYLFWSVNITPKKINRSLAFDLYPLLRREDWLDRITGHKIYRETRCQELVETLWSHPSSPWHERINMLGETGISEPMVTQAAWIRSLSASFVKEYAEEDDSKVGGLFGATRGSDEIALPWNRPMQAAFLIAAGKYLQDAVRTSNATWAKSLRKLEEKTLLNHDSDAAFSGKFSLLATDQGIRGWLQITNDLSCVHAETIGLRDWVWDDVFRQRGAKSTAATDEGAVSIALKSLESGPIQEFLQQLGDSLSSYDWRTSSTPGLTEDERLARAVFRGSGGYKELRKQLLQHLSKSKGEVAQAAKATVKILGYDKQ